MYSTTGWLCVWRLSIERLMAKGELTVTWIVFIMECNRKQNKCFLLDKSRWALYISVHCFPFGAYNEHDCGHISASLGGQRSKRECLGNKYLLPWELMIKSTYPKCCFSSSCISQYSSLKDWRFLWVFEGWGLDPGVLQHKTRSTYYWETTIINPKTHLHTCIIQYVCMFTLIAR